MSTAINTFQSGGVDYHELRSMHADRLKRSEQEIFEQGRLVGYRQGVADATGGIRSRRPSTLDALRVVGEVLGLSPQKITHEFLESPKSETSLVARAGVCGILREYAGKSFPELKEPIKASSHNAAINAWKRWLNGTTVTPHTQLVAIENLARRYWGRVQA